MPARFRALDYILSEALPAPPSACWTCPFSTLNLILGSPDPADPRKGYFDCSLIDATCWGQNPQCSWQDWQRQGRAEIGDAMELPSEAAREQLNQALMRIGAAESGMHDWADRYRELATLLEQFRTVLKEVVRDGEHDGPCDNEDNPYDSCDRHLATANERKQRALDLLGTRE